MLPTEDVFFEEACDTASSIEDEMIEQDTRQQLLSACGKLKPPYDEVARLHFYEELTAAQIADHLSVNVKTVQTQIYRAKAMLKKQLQNEYDILSERSGP